VRLDPPLLLQILGLLDGTRTVEVLAAAAGCTTEVARASVEALAAAALVVP
jgi:hypothetical protein